MFMPLIQCDFRFKVNDPQCIYVSWEKALNVWILQVHLDCVQFYASSENVSLLPLVVRLNSVKTPT